MHSGNSTKIGEMRLLAEHLREYAARRSFAIYAEKMEVVAKELDRCATAVEARGFVLQ
ncbi:MAG: hypothetical protein ABSC92_14300 [Rhizomicrobium sp.]|jgi:hypothetical protein